MSAVQAVQKNFYLPDKSITIDGDLSEWGDPLIVDGEDNPDRTRYCWNEDVLDWEVMPDADSCASVIYDEQGQIDIDSAWFGVNEKNMLLAFTTAIPMFSFVNGSTDEIVNFSDMERLSQLGIDHFPNDESFSHDMVFSFDADPVKEEESFDWYLVANLDFDLSSFGGDVGEQDDNGIIDDAEEPSDEEQESDPSFLQVWQEEGTTVGFQEEEDTLIDSIDPDLSEVSSDMSDTTSNIMEIRQNVEKFYELTGIQAGDEVGFRLETKSSMGDETKTVQVVFQDEALIGLPGKPLNLKAKEIKKTSTLLNWVKPKGTTKVTNYQVNVRPQNNDDRSVWKQYKNVKSTSKLVAKLQARKKYEFRVSACNTSGCGEWTKWVKFQTKAK